ncbi:MAG: Transcriptional regulator, GntR family protein [Labilithrix sp.]|nr:Transcriptional regulator, GntR family protein [Labilithrix sp.]
MPSAADVLPKVVLGPLGERAPLSIAVARRLREAIVSGAMKVGTELPSEKDLARDLGVGRSTIREALRILQAQGLLSGGDTVSTVRPRVTADLTLGIAATTMENVLRLGRVPLRDLVELRVLVEGAALRHAAAHPAPAAIAEAHEAVRAMKGAGGGRSVDIDTFRAADLRFHRSLLAACGNVAFSLVMDVLRNAVLGHLGEQLLRVPNAREAMAVLTREHEAILSAVEQGEGPRAAELVTAHVHDFYRDELEHEAEAPP